MVYKGKFMTYFLFLFSKIIIIKKKIMIKINELKDVSDSAASNPWVGNFQSLGVVTLAFAKLGLRSSRQRPARGSEAPPPLVEEQRYTTMEPEVLYIGHH